MRPMLIGAFLPWTVLARRNLRAALGHAVVADRLGARRPPDSALTRWSASFPDPSHSRSGLLLAFSLVEPLVQVRARQVAAVTPVEHSEEPVEEPSERPAERPVLAETR